MNFIKGLVTPPVQFPQNPQEQNQVGGGMQWSQGTRTQAQAQGVAPSASSSDAKPRSCNTTSSRSRSSPRTLLTMLEENKVITRQQFEATKNRLDMMDGTIDNQLIAIEPCATRANDFAHIAAEFPSARRPYHSRTEGAPKCER